MLRTSASLKVRPETSNAEIALSEVISALTFALDLTEGAKPGHALRCCLLGLRLGEAIGLPPSMMHSLYYALLLKDAGCSSNAARMTSIVGGDDRTVKYAAKLADWTKPHRVDLRTIQTLWVNVVPGEGATSKIARLAHMAVHQRRNNREMIALRCDRGADIVRMLDLGEQAAETVRLLDEHWDGNGYPDGLRGREIPVLARIAAVAQNLDVFAVEDGTERSIEVLRQRSGRWFDPELVRVAETLHRGGELWRDCAPGEAADESRAAVLDAEPGAGTVLGPDRTNRVCEAFAGVVDAKSPFTYRHSLGVAGVATGLARELGFSAEGVQTIRRVALLHDLGKLAISNKILDKPGSLSETEWTIIRSHPGLTRSILERVAAFDEVAVIASEHHERLDGSGYPNKLTAMDLSLGSRVIAMADQFAAMGEPRPYQRCYRPEDTLAFIREQCVPHKLDADCYEALCAVTSRREAGEASSPAPVHLGAATELLSC